MRRTAPILALLWLASPALSEVWADPDLPAALASSSLVVVARAPAEGSQGQPWVTFRVERLLHGGQPPPEVVVGGLHDPTAVAGPSFEPDEQVLLLLVRGDDGKLRVPTPTFGRFPLRGETVLFAALRDTFLRLELPRPDYERFLQVALGRPPEAAWLEGLRAHLGGSGPGEAGPARARSYLALETLALCGERSAQVEAAVGRYLDPGAPFQLRVSAVRALAACAVDPATRLLEAAGRDPEPAVRSAAATLLGRVVPPPPGLVARLAALLAQAPTGRVRFVGPGDPRLNTWPSPREALLQSIAKLGPAPARAALLEQLDQPELPGEELGAVARALVLLRDDADLPRELARRLRGTADLRDQALCGALTRLTGLPHGEDVAAWKTWADGR